MENLQQPNIPDMYYRFTWDTEPTDEQLEQLMREVGEEVQCETATANKSLQALMELEMQRVATYEKL